MYPEEEEGPQYRPTTTLSIGMMDDAAIDDDVALQEAEQWTKAHPLSRGFPGYNNLGFQDVSAKIWRGVIVDKHDNCPKEWKY